MIKCLSGDDILRIHWQLVDIFEKDNDPISPAGPRDRGLVDSAASRPRTSLGGFEKYETVEHKAAALFHSLVLNHAFHNGNKRTALVSLLVFLDQNDRLIEVGDDEVFDMVIAVAEHRLGPAERNADASVAAIRDWIRKHTIRRGTFSSAMRTAEFLERVEAAGGTYREAGSGGSWIVQGPDGRSIRISQSTQKLEANIVKNYLTKIGMSQGQTGVYYTEFRDGIHPEQEMIRRFRSVLSRLSHA
jgi:death-on-curing family protein